LGVRVIADCGLRIFGEGGCWRRFEVEVEDEE
jgi:hypothetical protein